ncbi:MAG: hypothetical protein IJV97_02200 [Alphaproteobacteria bacterium]|nr:hypothetical protein [Alphaproteobacteria bacterium]
MQQTIDKISQITNCYTGKKLDIKQLIYAQRKLALNNMPEIPEDYVKVLREYNSLSGDGYCIFGVKPREETDLDIVTENTLIPSPDKHDTLILGWNELEYLQWNKKLSCYQIIDKFDFEVLKTYQTCKLALMDFLRLNDE